MADVVLVHGAWHGAWCWQRVVRGLWATGHRAFAVSLTGVGERAHQMSPDITLATHIADVMAVIDAEELRGALLVGHSYGGMVITGVADRIRDAATLSRLVYLDAMVPHPGESWSSTHTPATRDARRAAIAEHGALPPPDPALFGLTDAADSAWVARRQTPQPGSLYDDPLHFDPARVARWPRQFIDCNAPALATIDVMRQRVRAEAGWQIDEIATGHDAMISAPEALLALLTAEVAA